MAETPLHLPPQAATPPRGFADGGCELHQASRLLACAGRRLYSSPGSRVGSKTVIEKNLDLSYPRFSMPTQEAGRSDGGRNKNPSFLRGNQGPMRQWRKNSPRQMALMISMRP